jgi:hypothetical protein
MGTSNPARRPGWLGWKAAFILLVVVSSVALISGCPWVRGHLKHGPEKRASLLEAAPFAEASSISQLLGVTTAILVLADGVVAPNESTFVDKLISNNSLLAQEQGEFDLTAPMLARIDPNAWRSQYQACVDSYLQQGAPKGLPFTAADYFQFKDTLPAKVSHTDSPERDAQLLLALSRVMEGADSAAGAGADEQQSQQEFERAIVVFRKLRKTVNHPEQQTHQNATP